MSRLHRASLFAVLLLYASIALWYTVKVPLGEGVDEVAHFDYVLFVKNAQRLPIQRPELGQIDTLMGHHPPLYYVLAAVLIAPIDTSDRPLVLHANPHFVWDRLGIQGWNVMLPEARDHLPWSGTLLAFRLIRLFNVALGALAVLCTFLACRQLLPNRPWAPLGAAALIGLNPSFIYMASTIHHDVLQAALFSAGLLWCVRYATRRIGLGALLAVGVLIAAAILTKLSGAVLAPVVCLVLFMRRRRDGDWGSRPGSRLGTRLGTPLGSRVGQVLLAGCVATLLAGWWFVRNQILYGDPFGWRMWLTIFAHTARPGPFTWYFFVNDFLAGLARTFWGAFGFMHILLPVWTWLIAWALTAIALFGWIFICIRSRRRLAALGRDRLVPWVVVAAGFVLLFLSFVRMAVSVTGAGHGRYLFPGAVAIGAILIAGANGYASWRLQKPISLALVCVMAAYAVLAPALYVWPKYQLPPTVSPETLATAKLIDLPYTGGLRLVAVRTSNTILVPGEGMDVTTFWSADPDVDPELDPYVTVALVTEAQRAVGAASFWPELSTTPRVWGTRVIANKQSFYIPPDQVAGSLRVQVSVTDRQGGKPLSSTVDPKATTATVADLLALGQVSEISEADLPARNLAASFAGVVELETAVMPPKVPAGSALPVQLYWKVLAPVPPDYTVFVHVLDSAGKLVAQLDRPPGGGTSPTSTWRPGAYLRDTYPVVLPPALAAGTYQVRMGLYTWPDLARQPIVANGSPAGDIVTIGEIAVVP